MFSKTDLKKLLGPLVIEQLLAVTIGIADTIMVATVGETAVSAVSLVDTINILMINIFAALATGGAIVTSQYLGRNDVDNANKASKQLVYVVGLLGIVLAAVCVLGNRYILSALFGNTEPVVLSNAQTYFFWTALSYPFIAVYNAGAALFRSMGNSSISMRTSIVMNFINVAGNALCIFGLRMGVAGAAIPTFVSRAFGALLMVLLLRYGTNLIQFDHLRGFRFDGKMVKTILGFGIPSGLENGMFQIGKIIVLRLISSFGTIAITANAVNNTICMLPQIPAMAVGLGMITVVGQCVGAGEYQQAEKYTKQLLLIANVPLVFLCGLLFFFRWHILALFNLSAETAAVANQLIISYCIAGSLMWPLSFVFPNSLRAAGDVKYTMTISMLSMWIFRIGFSYLIAAYFGLGVLGVWFAMYIDWFVRIVFFITRFASGKWKKQKTVV